MLNKNVEVFMGCDTGWHFASTVLFGAPFDSTTSNRPGTRFGPSALRRESYGLETYSPYQDRDLMDIRVFDSGDLELCFGSSEMALSDIEKRAEEILNAGKFPLLLGGEHLVTLGSIRAVRRKYSDLRIIHLDAHADLRDDYLGVKYSHACVMRRCWELLGDGHIFQFGIRSGDREEFEWARGGHVEMHPFRLEGIGDAVRRLSDCPIYLTLDLDVLDPSVFPGTGTPEAGGAGFMELLEALLEICENSTIVGCDVVELSPHYDASGVSTAAAGKLIRELLLGMQH